MSPVTSDEVDLLELIEGEVLNTVNAARVLNIPERTVRYMCRAGQLPGAKQYAGYGGKWLIPKGAIRVLRDWPEDP
jgi:hypothetical protein